jgi:hypothetical protein
MMIITDPSRCYLVQPQGLYEECRQALAPGGAGFFDPDLYAAGLAWDVLYLGIVVVLLVLSIGLIIAAAANDNLSGREKAGWVIGAIIAPVLFLPLYLIFSRPAPAVDPATLKPAEGQEGGQSKGL